MPEIILLGLKTEAIVIFFALEVDRIDNWSHLGKATYVLSSWHLYQIEIKDISNYFAVCKCLFVLIYLAFVSEHDHHLFFILLFTLWVQDIFLQICKENAITAWGAEIQNLIVVSFLHTSTRASLPIPDELPTGIRKIADVYGMEAFSIQFIFRRGRIAISREARDWLLFVLGHPSSITTFQSIVL